MIDSTGRFLMGYRVIGEKACAIKGLLSRGKQADVNAGWHDQRVVKPVRTDRRGGNGYRI